MANPAISIVLPTRNRERMLAVAVESIQAQTFADWELILVDDQSTDQTADFSNEAAKLDSRVRVLRNDHNLGLARSLNRGFAVAKGRLLTWTSDDNRCHGNCLARTWAELESLPHVGLVYASMNIVDEDDRFLRPWRAEAVEAQPIQPWVGACFLYRRQVYELVGDYDPAMTLAEDLDYWIRVRLSFPMRPIQEVLYDYREHPQSLSSMRRVEVKEAGARVVERHLPRLDWLTSENRARTLLGLAEAAMQRRDRAAARRWIRLAMKADSMVLWRHYKRGVLSAFLGV